MAQENGAERYSVCIDAGVASKEALFSRVTDTAYLGYSYFSGWDAFEELFHDRLECNQIEIEIDNEDLSGLSEDDRSTWLDVLKNLEKEFPEKLRMTRSSR